MRELTFEFLPEIVAPVLACALRQLPMHTPEARALVDILKSQLFPKITAYNGYRANF